MSVRIMGEVWSLKLPHPQMLLLLAMADHADHTGANVFPSIGLLAWKTGYSERGVHRIARQLEQAGLLVKTSRPGRASLWSIDTSKGEKKPPHRPLTKRQGSALCHNDTPDKAAGVTPDKRADPDPCHNDRLPLTQRQTTPDTTADHP